jgi:hypothetical protein
VILDARRELATREELLAELDRLDARERGLREQRRDVDHRLEQIAQEKARLQRHLGRVVEARSA